MSIDKLERSNRRLDAAVPSSAADSNENQTPAGHIAVQRYAEELTARFQAYMDWAIVQWPINGEPLDPAMFDRSREDLAAICKRAGAGLEENDPAAPGGVQFVPVTPMPWP